MYHKTRLLRQIIVFAASRVLCNEAGNYFTKNRLIFLSIMLLLGYIILSGGFTDGKRQTIF
jgi:hypothetical protein